MSEAWIASARPEDRADPMHPAVLPRDREDRREILVVSYAWRDDDGKHVMVSTPEIERRANGKVSGLASAPVLTEDADNRIESRLRSVIPDGPVHPEAQAAARRAVDELFIMRQPEGAA
jgi:hypothetical protein